jgi:hypothetical protein
MKKLSFGRILCLTTMFAMISGQRQTIRHPHQRRALPDRNSPRPRKYWREIQEVPEPVTQAEPPGEAKQQRRPGPRKSEAKARPVHLAGGLSKVFAIPVPPPPQDPAEETEQTGEEPQNQPSDETAKIQKNSKKTNTVSATSTEGMMWGRMQGGMQGNGSAQQSAGTAEDSDAAQQDEGLDEGENIEDVKSKGETQQTPEA